MNNELLAIKGGLPTRKDILQYGFQTLDESDINAVIEVLRENKYLTAGPRVNVFEDKVKEYCNCKHACAVNSGTAALHMAVACLNLKPTDEVIVTCLSFVASANAIVYCNAIPVFCDIESDTMNIDSQKIEKLITTNTKAIICVDFAGQACNFKEISKICKKYNLYLIEDAAHSMGGYIDEENNTKIGAFADLTTFSFHPVKNITTCEGGMVLTNNDELFERMKNFGKHGITRDFKSRESTITHYYEMTDIGYNYRIPDLLCAMGINQLTKLDSFIEKRKKIASIYDREFLSYSDLFTGLTEKYTSVYHIYVIKLKLDNLTCDRDEVFKALKHEGIGVNVHYMPIHLHPYYINKFNTFVGMCPVAENIYKEIITLPIFPLMTIEDINDVIRAVKKVILYYKK
uniref:DegT/DnrJ/EryC1/StrS aminotransferase family protein n=1 Tax=viral metagenome TaxID=1070528 RepID=A0A6C0E4Q9_9ZZZZ